VIIQWGTALDPWVSGGKRRSVPGHHIESTHRRNAFFMNKGGGKCSPGGKKPIFPGFEVTWRGKQGLQKMDECRTEAFHFHVFLGKRAEDAGHRELADQGDGEKKNDFGHSPTEGVPGDVWRRGGRGGDLEGRSEKKTLDAKKGRPERA